MKKFVYIFIVNCSLLTVNCYSQWVMVSNQGNEAVSFPSVNTGYSTANGITKKTTNGGVNWTTLSGGNLTGIFFINDLTGWVVGYPGFIGRTTTGGSFVQQPTGVVDRLNDVFFIDNNTGWVVGGDFSAERIFKTTNAGDNWTPQTSGTANKLFSVHFINALTGWSVGGPSSPKIIKTTNGGDNWVTQFTSASTPLYAVKFADANTGWAVAGYLGGETIIKTTNGGTNWFSQSSGDTRYLRDCWVVNSQIAFAVGQGGKIIKTTNGGNNWIVQPGTSIELWSVRFVNDTLGYAIGDNVVMKTTNQGITFANSNNSEVPDNFSLEQNYPNPFNPSTTIKFAVPPLKGGSTYGARGMTIQLIIYDALGKEITTLVNKQLQPGSYSVSWDASNYPSGVYFYKLVVGDPSTSLRTNNYSSDYTETKKMLLIK